MTRACDVGALVLLVLVHFCSVTCVTIPINCNSATTPENSEINGQFTSIDALTTLSVECTNLRPEVSFIIFQVHTYRHNVTLYQDKILPNSSFVGTNIGMYSKNLGNTANVFSIANFNNVSMSMYISIHGYNDSAPIPGGCNLVSPVEVNPTLDLGRTDSVIRLSAAPGKILNDVDCGSEQLPNSNINIEHTFYRLYLAERDFSEEIYFEGIRKMITRGNIENYAEEVPKSWFKDQLLKVFSLYPGTGSVYVTVVIATRGSAVYVPTHTYGCSQTDGEDDCSVFSDIFSQVICALMFFTGLFVCYFGHRFFKTEMFLMGVLVGAIVTYIVVSQATSLEPAAMLGATLLSGMFCGAIWWLFWWFYGMPMFSVLLATLLLGFLSSSLLMFVVAGSNETLSLDANYWSIFFIVMLFVSIALLSVTLQANILCCAVLGAYATVYPIDYYIGSNLKYIVINVVRRAVVPGFQKAYLIVPFQWRDVALTLLWIMLSITGFLFQKYHNRGRAPFPPPPRNAMPTIVLGSDYNRRYSSEITPWMRPRTRRLGNNERSPLLGTR